MREYSDMKTKKDLQKQDLESEKNEDKEAKGKDEKE
jgi:hypothetical protein